MVGIVLASHGGFAEGIFQSAGMIFGEQPDVKAVILKPNEGPDDIHQKMVDAIKSFSSDDQVLFLVDLWGGTPFNQANNLVEQHADKWAIVAGMNLPMVIEAYSARMSSESAHEIAQKIIAPAQDGVKVKPESLQPKPKQAAAVKNNEPTGTLPEGTVVGDGHIKYVLARIDSRLLHGQVATAWTKTTQPNRIIVVSDGVSKDNLRKKLIEQACPPGVKANVIPLKKLIQIKDDPRFGNTKALLLFENPEDVLTVVKAGVKLPEINIGSMAHSVGKVVVNKVLSMNNEDVAAFEELKKLGVKFDVRKVPNDGRENMDELLQKAKSELAKA